MATLASDSFDRADSSSIGSDWTEASGNWEILSNVLSLNSASLTDAESYDWVTWDTALGASPAADYDISAVVNMQSSKSGSVAGRLTDGNNQYMARIATVNQTVALKKYVSGSVTQLGSFTGGYAATTNYTLKLTMSGTNFAALVDGVSRVTASDSDISATGKPALKTNGTSCTFNDFLVEGTSATGSSIKTVNGLAVASVKTVNELAIASVKTIKGLA